MRSIVTATVVAVLALSGALAPLPAHDAAAATAPQPKIVFVVGQTEGATAGYIADANAAAAVAAQYTSNIVKVYSPHATWAAVSAAMKGANIVVYMGHGTGYPNPYVSYLQPWGDDGMGLNASATNSALQYYGENYMAMAGLAPNAVVLLNHLCYASGDNEWGSGNPTLSVAEQRVDNYASGFIRGGARAVIADGTGDIGDYITALFTTHQTLDQLWRTVPDFNNNVITFPSVRSPGRTAELDPDLQHPAPDGDVYYRSMVTDPALTTDDVVGAAPPFASQSGTYTPLSPVRVLDTRSGVGLSGKFVSHLPRTFQVGGVQGVPAGAIAITGNLTVTDASGQGYVFLGPWASPYPSSSTLNFPAGDVRANGVTVALAADGSISAVFVGRSSTDTTNLLLDVTGYFTAGTTGATYHGLDPVRVLDSRSALGVPASFVTGTPQTFAVAGPAGIPSDAVAITGNVTVARTSVRGYVTLSDTASANPTTSTLNLPARDTRANNVTMPLGANGTLSAVFISGTPGATADIILDVTGYFTAGTGGAIYHTMQPTRLLDTRYGIGIASPLQVASPANVQIGGQSAVDGSAVAITGNLTVVGQTASGYVFVAPAATSTPGSSTLNFPVGDVRANGVTVRLASGGALGTVYMATQGSASTALILDVTGYFQ